MKVGPDEVPVEEGQLLQHCCPARLRPGLHLQRVHVAWDGLVREARGLVGEVGAGSLQHSRPVTDRRDLAMNHTP